MKKLLLVFLLTSACVFSQDKYYNAPDNTLVYTQKDVNSPVLAEYLHGAILEQNYKNSKWVSVNVKGVEGFIVFKEKAIILGMSDIDFLNTMGKPDSESHSHSNYGDSDMYKYGRTFYHFKDFKLVAINQY